MAALVGFATLALALIGAARVTILSVRGARRMLRALARRLGYALVHMGTEQAP